MAEFPTGFSRDPSAANRGQIANTRDARVDPKTVASGTVTAGRFVAWHAGDAADTVRLPTTATEVNTNKAKGVAVLDMMRGHDDASAPSTYAASEMLPVLRQGEIWVYCEMACDPSSQVFVRITESTGGAADQGQFRADSDSAKATLCPGLAFLDTLTAAGMTRLAVNIPNGLVGPTGATGPTGPTGPTG